MDENTVNPQGGRDQSYESASILRDTIRSLNQEFEQAVSKADVIGQITFSDSTDLNNVAVSIQGFTETLYDISASLDIVNRLQQTAYRDSEMSVMIKGQVPCKL